MFNTSISGLNGSQKFLDTTSNNIANVNSYGFKRSRAEFADIYTNTVFSNSHTATGMGTTTTTVAQQFVQGSLTGDTGNNLDMAISGNGFFVLSNSENLLGADVGDRTYTRNGAFQMAIDGDGVTLSTAEGYPVLDQNGDIIHFNTSEYNVTNISTDEYGRFIYRDAENDDVVDTGIRIGLAQFNNPSGLDKLSSSIYRESPNSGEPRYEIEDPALSISKIHAKYLEGSNVQTVDEIVNLITTQRAYEMNSKIISAADEMMQQANNLR